MMRLFLLKLRIYFCLSIAIIVSQQSAILPASAVEYYVTPVLPNPKCPQDHCFKLDQYALNSSQYLSNHNNVTMYFLDGNHNLTQQLKFTDIKQLSWLGNPGRISHIQIECRASVTFSNVSEVELLNVNIKSMSNYCYNLSFDTYSFRMEEVLIKYINITVYSNKTISIVNSTMNSSPLVLKLLGNLLSLEAVIVNSRLINSPGGNSLKYWCVCDKCQTVDLIMHNLTTNQSMLLPFQNHENNFGDVILSILIQKKTHHRVKITNSSFNRSPLTGVVFYHIIANNTDHEIIIEGTNFSQNQFSGIMVFLYGSSELSGLNYRVKFHLKNCTFMNNTINSDISPTEPGSSGSAITIVEAPSMIDILISQSTFIGNTDTGNIPTTIFILRHNVTIMDSLFSKNIGTGLKTHNSHVFITGNVQFDTNSAYEGGGLTLVNSYLHLSNNSNLTFINNTAQHVGGGILVKPHAESSTDSQSTPKCFYQIDKENDIITVLMVNNTAQHGGDHIYGASLKSQCKVGKENYLPILSYKVQEKIFHFCGDSNSQVSSDPTRVCLCDQGVPNCTDIDKLFNQISRFPGETFSISAALVGNDFGTTSGTLYVHGLLNQSTELSISELQLSQTVNKSCSNIEFTIHSNEIEQWETLVLTPFFNTQPTKHTKRKEMKKSISEYNKKGYIPTDLLQTPTFLEVYILQCPPGFTLSDRKCQCDPTLTKHNIYCTIEDGKGYIYRSGSVWINFLSDNDNRTTGRVIMSKFCPHQYCIQKNIPIQLDKPNKQCAFNHSGTLCGGCKQKQSLMLGSQRCSVCDNNRRIALLLFFILAGFLLVLFIKFFDLTVTHGTINGLIFYSNIVWVNQSILFPEIRPPAVNILRVFIAWINLDFGIETCFFNGLDAYWKTWMQFLFPIYIWTIAGLIIVLCRYSTAMTRLFGKNSVSVLATLILLSYAKLLRTIINIFEVAVLEFQKGQYLLVWALDGNIRYIISKHGPLFCAGLVAFLFLWLPYTMALFLVPWLRGKSNWKCLRWINKLKPFFDANFGPLKDRQHYWIGVLLLVRGFLFIIMLLATTSKISQSANLVSIILTVACLLAHPDPYKKWYVSLLEKSFFVNVTIISVGVYHNEVNKLAVTITSISLALLQFGVIILAHVYLLLHGLNVCNKFCCALVNRIHTDDDPVKKKQNEHRFAGLSGRAGERYQQLLETIPGSDEDED